MNMLRKIYVPYRKRHFKRMKLIASDEPLKNIEFIHWLGTFTLHSCMCAMCIRDKVQYQSMFVYATL